MPTAINTCVIARMLMLQPIQEVFKEPGVKKESKWSSAVSSQIEKVCVDYFGFSVFLRWLKADGHDAFFL